MNFLAYGLPPGGPTDKLCPSEEPNEAMVDRGPDGRMVPTDTWRAHTPTNRDALRLLSAEIFRPKPLVVPPLLERSHENNVSTRDRLARSGADARIEESAALGEVRLALRPYGRYFSVRFDSRSEYGHRPPGPNG